MVFCSEIAALWSYNCDLVGQALIPGLASNRLGPRQGNDGQDDAGGQVVLIDGPVIWRMASD